LALNAAGAQASPEDVTNPVAPVPAHRIEKGTKEMKMRILIFLVVAMLPVSLRAQVWSSILSPSRAIDWTQAGIPGGIPNRTAVCSTLNASSFGNGSSDASGAIQSAMNSCGTNGVVSLSAGKFRLGSCLTVPSGVVLRGQGANQTVLDVHCSGSYAISLGSGGQPDNSQDVSVTGGATQGSKSITVSNAGAMSVGSYLEITEQNDSSFMSINGSEGSCGWCDEYGGSRVAGQIVEITSINGNTIGISPALYLTYNLSPTVTPFKASAKYAGVENLQMYANNSGAGSTFGFEVCMYCWIKGIENNYADGDHVDTDWSYRGEIVDSYFSNAYIHAPGNYDSDIDLRHKTSGFLVQNNILERLHVSIMLEWGSSGNVIAYNFAFGNFDGAGAGLLFPGINTHGAHPMFNLLEGNSDVHIHMDSIWGSHSHNTLFRNWVKGTTKIGCSPADGSRGTVDCSGGHWTTQGDRPIDIDFLGSNYNYIGDVVGSAELTATGMAGVRMVVGACGPSPCGAGTRQYEGTYYLYSLGYGEAVDSGSDGTESAKPFSTGLFHGEFDIVSNVVNWASSLPQVLPSSLYLSGKPAWFGNAHWPPIGPDVTGGPGPGGHAYLIPAEACYKNTMGGTDGSGSPLTFNAANCYPSSGTTSQPPLPPTNIQAVPH
jgi:hypothetical protein